MDTDIKRGKHDTKKHPKENIQTGYGEQSVEIRRNNELQQLYGEPGILGEIKMQK